MRRISTLIWLGLFAWAAVSAPGAGAATCLGKQATITANGKRINGTGGSDVIVAGPGNNRILGGGGRDTICAGAGNDLVDGSRGGDNLDGGPGRDVLRGDRGSDTARGGGGRDRLLGENGNDRLNGGGGARDFVDGGPGDEPLASGGAGNFDVVLGNSGGDRIVGGPGRHDIASYATSSSPITINLATGRSLGDVRERLRGIEDVIGGAGADSIRGSAARNRLDGGPGDDRLTAAGAGDAAFGGPGSDTCRGRFAREGSCGAEGTSPRVIGVELIRSIDNSSSLVVTGTGFADEVRVTRVSRGFRVTSRGRTRVAPGSGQAKSCDPVKGDAVRCTGRAGRLVASLGSGGDELDASGLPRFMQTTIDGQGGPDALRGGQGPNTIFSGDDRAPDRLVGGRRNDVLFGINTAHPRIDSGRAVMRGLGGGDLMVGGQPCDGDLFDGGRGGNDSASFARVRNSGIIVIAVIGGAVRDPNVRGCDRGRITAATEKIEGSKGPDVLIGDDSPNDLLGMGGDDRLSGRGGPDRCEGGGGRDRARGCEERIGIPRAGWAQSPRPGLGAA